MTPYAEDDKNGTFVKQLNKHIKQMRLRSARLVKWERSDWMVYFTTVGMLVMLEMLLVIFLLIWLCWYRGGFTFNVDLEPNKYFNWHPLLMITGFILCSGMSITLHRCCRCLSSDCVELLHAVLHTCALPCICYGFAAAWQSHNAKTTTNTKHFYNLHSWLGVFTLTLFCAQLMIAYVCAILIRAKCDWLVLRQRSLKSVHATIGLMNFLFAVGTAVTGLLEKQHDLDLTGIKGGDIQPHEHCLIMGMCTILLMFAVVVTLCVRKSNAPTHVKFRIRGF